jgi:hypothetical protein
MAGAPCSVEPAELEAVQRGDHNEEDGDGENGDHQVAPKLSQRL